MLLLGYRPNLLHTLRHVEINVLLKTNYSMLTVAKSQTLETAGFHYTVFQQVI